MSIINYANRVNPTKVRIDQNKPPKKKTFTGGGDINGGFSHRVSHHDNWKITNINISFNSEVSKSFAISLLNGINIVKDRNDYLWFKLIDDSIKFATFHKQIILDPGFYMGSELANELQSKLDIAFDPYSITFTVDYNEATGEFSITPSSANIVYLQINPVMPHTKKDSIGGHLFGFNTNSEPEAVLVSQFKVFGLNSSTFIALEDTSTDISYINNDNFNLSLDQALVIEGSSVAEIILSYSVNTELED